MEQNQQTKNSYRTHIRLSEEEFHQLQKDSQSYGTSIPELMKKTYFKGPLPQPLFTKEDAVKFMVELKRIGNNLNQVAKHLNSGIREGFHKEIEQVYDGLLVLGKYIGAYGHR